jgi:DNA-binding CsgD family transcriptional regulator
LGRTADQRGAQVSSPATTAVRLAELLGRLSLAFDIANEAPFGKGVRSVVLALELGRRAGATDGELHDTFWLSLLGYLGCEGLDADQAPPPGGHASSSDIFTKLAQIVGAGPRVLSALTDLHARGDRAANRSAGDTHGLPMRLLRLGQFWDLANEKHGRAGAAALIRQGARSELDPRLAEIFSAEQPALLASIDDPRIFDRFLESEPGPGVCADEHRVDDVARALAILADLRCPMFFGHSTSVAALAERAAVQMGLSADDVRSLRRAALLHDIGRLGVPNSIWTRPGRLDWGEMERVRLHAYYTERVLAPIRVLGPVAEIAASAHEHVDGSGYPQSRTGRSLLPGARILAAADIAIAMSEPRPHRPALSPDALARELVGEVEAGHVDAAAADAVLASLGSKIRVVSRHAHGVSERELEVCRLIAQGKMNKEIADVLGISLRTVQNHVAHIFDKLGLHSRAGVAVWLVENDFVQ